MIINHKKIRYVGNALTLVGHFLYLHVDPRLGLIKIAGFLMAMYSCKELKLWDVIILLLVFMVIDSSYILRSL